MNRVRDFADKKMATVLRIEQQEVRTYVRHKIKKRNMTQTWASF